MGAASVPTVPETGVEIGDSKVVAPAGGGVAEGAGSVTFPLVAVSWVDTAIGVKVATSVAVDATPVTSVSEAPHETRAPVAKKTASTRKRVML